MSLELILSRIAAGESVPSTELLPYLCQERREQRANVNVLLAKAYSQTGTPENLRHARVFIRRAWLLSSFSPEILPLYVKIHVALDDIDGIKDAYKRAGMIEAGRGNASAAITYFDRWQYAFAEFKNIEKYEYDFDILDCVERLARPHRFSARLQRGKTANEKLRVAYLIKGATEVGSILVKICLQFARLHDRSRIEPLFFTPESRDAVAASAAGPEYIKQFAEAGCPLIMVPESKSTEERLVAVARAIHDSQADILVTSAALAEFQHYFVTSMRPAPLIVGLLQGPPQQFAPPNLDWGIAWSRHPFMDSPVDGSLSTMELDSPAPSNFPTSSRDDLDIPADAVVIASAGRHHKFQEPRFWQAVIEILQENASAHYLAIGVDKDQLAFLPPMMPPEVESRIRFLSWRGADYVGLVALADILIDTFPSGGGAVLSDAMALGIPVVSFRNNYLRLYDQTDWSPAEELVDTHELIPARGDFAEMKRIVARLIDDPDYRRNIARHCQDYIAETRSNPERAVRRVEKIYRRVFEEKLSGKISRNEWDAEVDQLSRRLTYRAPAWVVGTADQIKRIFRFGERLLDRVTGKQSFT